MVPDFDTKYYKFRVELTLNNQLKKKCQKTYIDMIKITLKPFMTLKVLYEILPSIHFCDEVLYLPCFRMKKRKKERLRYLILCFLLVILLV
jgi:hypothetical protein